MGERVDHDHAVVAARSAVEVAVGVLDIKDAKWAGVGRLDAAVGQGESGELSLSHHPRAIPGVARPSAPTMPRIVFRVNL